MDRALASFVSPGGVYLLAQGIGALGKLPFRSKEGGLGLAKEAAAKRSAAIAQLKDAELAQKQMKAGQSQQEVRQQRERMAERDPDAMPDTVTARGNMAMQAEMQAIEGQRKMQFDKLEKLQALIDRMPADDPDRMALIDQAREVSDVFTQLTEAQKQLGAKDRRSKELDQRVADTKREFEQLAYGGPVTSETRMTVPEERILQMVTQAQREGRASTAADAAALSEEAIRKQIEEELPTPELIQSEQLADMDDEQLRALANQVRKDNKQFERQSRTFQEKFGEQINPFIVQQNIDKSTEARMANREAINRELRKRGRELAQRAPVSFLSERGQQLATLSPFQQKQELRRMAREVKSEEDAQEVRNLLGRFAPVRETLGDYFRTDDEIATEFEKEVVDLIPKFDPDRAQKIRLREAQIKQAEADVEQKKATTAKTAAETGQALLIALVNADAKKRRAAASAAAQKRKDQLKGKKDSAKKAQSDLNSEMNRLLGSIQQRAVRIKASKELSKYRSGTTPENYEQRLQAIYLIMGKDYITSSVATTDAAALLSGQVTQAAQAQAGEELGLK